METAPRSLWSWQHTLSLGRDERQFVIVSLARSEVLVETEENRAGSSLEVLTALPALSMNREIDSYVKSVHAVLEAEYRVCPIAVRWSDRRETILDNVPTELTKEVILINWMDTNSTCQFHLYFKWVPISQTLNIYHHFFEARSSIRQELETIQTSKCASRGLPWNSFGWVAEVTSKIEEVLNCSIRFSPSGVVMKATTSKGVYILKTCHPSSAEPAMVSITSNYMVDICDVATYVECSAHLVISADHGPSIISCLDESIEKKAAAGLATFEIMSVPLVDELLARGVLDARPSKHGVVQAISAHPEFRRIENHRNVSFEAV